MIGTLRIIEDTPFEFLNKPVLFNNSALIMLLSDQLGVHIMQHLI